MAESNAHQGGMLVQVPTTMETASGRFVDLLHPDPATIQVGDIAHHLSLINRYGGGTSIPVSVGAHTLLVCDLLAYLGATPAVQLGGLLHDAAEAYLSDVISPLKFALRLTDYDLVRDVACDIDIEDRLKPFDSYEGPVELLSFRMDQSIAYALGVDAGLFDDPSVKLADMWALRIEAERYTFTGGENWRWPGELPEDGQLPDGIPLHFGSTWRQVTDLWMDAYLGLRGCLGAEESR